MLKPQFGLNQVPSLIRLTAEQDIRVSPLGAAFIKQSRREGLLPKMLREVEERGRERDG